MCHYKHLTPFERERILFFLSRGESITKIAQLLNRSKSTISREIVDLLPFIRSTNALCTAQESL